MSVELCFLQVESQETVAQGVPGEICVSGPSVFKGYLQEEKDPFVCKEGKKWYRSGDLGYLDEQGNLHLVDRLKRTIKMGAEMISLSAIEQELSQLAIERSWAPPQHAEPLFALLVLAREKQELVLVTTLALSLEEVNAALREVGASRLVKISHIKKLISIPLLGTGKINYRELQKGIDAEGK